MSKPVLLSLGAGKVQELAGTANNDVLTWNASTGEWVSAAGGGGGGSGTVTSVGLTGGTSGIVIGGATSPITTSGTYDLNSPQRFQFDTSANFAPTAVGQLSWNANEGSLNTLMVGGNVDAIVGQQLYQRAVNGDTVTLTKGMVVYVFGSSGTRVTVKRATADADLTSATILGVVAETMTVNNEGFIITSGKLSDLTVLPSTTFADGDVVYLSPTTAGGLTPTKPEAPQHLVMVGYCVKASNGAAGVLVVHPQNGYELGELHDVYISSPASGQLLIYDATSGQTRWENASLTAGSNITVTNGPGSVTIAATIPAQPYDLRSFFVGNPASSVVLDRFVADRAVTVSTTTTDHRFYCVDLPASGTVVLTVYKTPLAGTGKVAMFTATFTAGGSAAGNGLYAATIGTVSNNTLVAGDLVTVEMGTTQAAFASPSWTIFGTA